MITMQFNSHDQDAAHAARSGIVQYLASAGEASSAELFDAEVTLGELISNVRKHGREPIFINVAWRDDGKAVLNVRDSGLGFDLSEWRPADVMAEHGRGLGLVAALTDAVEVDTQPGMPTYVRATLPIMRRLAA